MVDQVFELPEDQQRAVLRHLCESLLEKLAIRQFKSESAGIENRNLDQIEVDEICEPIRSVQRELTKILSATTGAFHEVDIKLSQLLAFIEQSQSLSIEELEAYLQNLTSDTEFLDSELAVTIQRALSAKPSVQAPSFTLLLFSDFHLGSEERPDATDFVRLDSEAKQSWNDENEIRAIFDLVRTDIEQLYPLNTRPWDLVVFAGDLFSKGMREKRNQIRKFWSRFHEHCIEKWKDHDRDTRRVAAPKVAATVGNHDLQQLNSESAKQLRNHSRNSNFSEIESSEIKKAISFWKEWWSEIVEFNAPEKRCYLDDGSFVAEMECRSQLHRIGIISINSVYDRVFALNQRSNNRGAANIHPEIFEHLRDRVEQFNGESKRQLLDSEVKTFDAWLERNDFNILITHYPFQHFSEEGQENLKEIYRLGKINLHLAGHFQPEDQEHQKQKDVILHQGQKTITWTNYSLFGRKQWGAKKLHKQRPYGYTAVEIHIQDDNFKGENKDFGGRAKVKIWPRLASPERQMSFVPAITHHQLKESQYLEEIVAPLHTLPPKSSQKQSTQFTYDVAVSYAGKDGEKIQPILEALKSKFGKERVFDYKDHQSKLMGTGMSGKLQKVFIEEAFWVIPFHSEQYKHCEHCMDESRYIRARILKLTDPIHTHVTEIRLDKTVIDGFPEVTQDHFIDFTSVDKNQIKSVATQFASDLGEKLQEFLCATGRSDSLET